MPRFNVTVLSQLGNAKHTYDHKSFPSMEGAIHYYQTIYGGRVVEIKEMGVRLHAPKQSGIVLARRHEHTEECGHIPRRDDEIPADCGLRSEELVEVCESKQKLLAAHFGIDLDKLEAEKRQLLESLQVETGGSHA